ncbi:MAG: ATP12 family protein [Rhodospirillales bacterium]
MKRFWQSANVTEQNGHYTIELDGRPMRLPNGPALRLRQKPLADAIAAEWQQAGGAVGGEMDFAAVPLTRLAGTAQDRVAPDSTPTAEALARYAEADALCYRAAQPQSLVIRQHHGWQPWLDWAAEAHGARLLTTNGLLHIPQPPEAVAALRGATHALDAFQLAGLAILVPAYGSLVLGLAVAAGRLAASEAHALSVLDELYQEQFWGADPDAAARRASVLRDTEDAARFMALAAA